VVCLRAGLHPLAAAIWFAPNVILNVLRQLDLIDKFDGQYQLTSLGERWASRIDWAPESLPAKTEEPDEQRVTALVSAYAPNLESAQVQLATLDTIRQRLSTAGYFSASLIAQLHHGLWAHPRRHFAVLTGLSGSGKTQLALQYGKAVAAGNSHDNVRVIPVQPGWHDPSPLLGYVNPLRSEVYVRTDFLEFFVEAAANPGTPYTVILDEMNLSRPEQYLAPILSAMETGAAIVLHREGDALDGMAATIPYPNNLAIIGTVNMDETTHGLSDKVLDRAFAIEFWDIDLSKYPKWNTRSLRAEDETRARQVLEGLMQSLQPARLHFGWRTVDYVLDYLAAAGSSQMSLGESLDSVIYAKVLPKLRGDDSVRFREALESCIKVLDANELPQSRRRVEELRHDLATTGSARFWR
jgi:5-methylcytosine-specific restriction enzyme B